MVGDRCRDVHHVLDRAVNIDEVILIITHVLA